MDSSGLKGIRDDVTAAHASLLVIAHGLSHFTRLTVQGETLTDLQRSIQQYQDRLDQYQRIMDQLMVLILDLDELAQEQFPELPKISFAQASLADIDAILAEETIADTVLHTKLIAAVTGTLTVSDEVNLE